MENFLKAVDSLPEPARTRKYARIATDIGFIPIILRPGEKRPLKAGWTDVTLEEAKNTFKTNRHGHNLAVLTGAVSGNFVIDIEVDDVPQWEASYGKDLQDTLTVETNKGGIHVYFVYDETLAPIRNGIKLILDGKKPAKFDIRTNRGNAIWMGTRLGGGNEYRPIRGFNVLPNADVEITLDFLPEDLRDKIIEYQSKIGRGRY